MPIESRDRLQRPVDIAAVFARRRSGILGILLDEPEITNLFGSPAHRANAPSPRGRPIGTPRATSIGRGRNLYGSPVIGRENMPIIPGTGRLRGRGRGGTNSVLPSWYPRTPLRDITAVVRAIERRRVRLREIDGQENESPIPQDQRVLNSSLPLSGAQLEHDISMISPNPTVGVKAWTPSVGKVPKILLNVTNQAAGESECLTPQKKLLNSIDKVEKEVMEELRKLKRTPTAKKAEREKRVRTLMSMR